MQATVVSRGTVKVGRWEYPAERFAGGTVMRNAKRDGSGTWVEVDAAKYVETEQVAPSVNGPKPAAAGNRSRADWRVGGRCPKGHLLSEDDIYEMPSGRKQCRKCRKNYGSNIAAKAS